MVGKMRGELKSIEVADDANEEVEEKTKPGVTNGT